MKRRVILAVTNDICTDQRVLKVYQSLLKHGFSPQIIGRKRKNSLPLNNIKHHRLKLLFNKTVLFYAEYNIRLFLVLLFKKTDIIVANDLDTLPACFIAARIRQKKLIFDSHELFTELPELVNKRFSKKVWTLIEKLFIPKSSHNITVCQSIADYYKNKYRVPFRVIKNLPLSQHFTALNQKENLFIYQGVLNLGRGIELMIDTMHYFDDYKLIIAGAGDIEEKLKKKVIDKNLQNKIQFTGRLSPPELKKITCKAKIGFSLEENLGLNYYYALPNKLFDYIMAETPVITSDFPEMSAIIDTHSAGKTLKERNSKKLAETIEQILNNYQHFHSATQKAKHLLKWELQEEKLILIYKNTYKGDK